MGRWYFWLGLHGMRRLQLDPLYFFAAVIPYMLVNGFSDEIDGES